MQGPAHGRETATGGTVVVISSHVMRGSVGLRAAAFALEVLGHPVWAVPTVTLPWHPGHAARAGLPPRDVVSAAALKAALDALVASPFAGEVRAVLTGYLGSADQVAVVAGFIDAMRARVPALTFTFDPVMGDRPADGEAGGGEGRLYIPRAQAEAMVEHLLPRADCVTPNLFELGWLTGETDPTAALAALGTPRALVTSWPALATGHIATLLRENGRAFVAEHRRIEGPAHGLGDLTAALFTGHALDRPPGQALERACASVVETLALSARRGADELAMEAAIGAILRPHGAAGARQLILPRVGTGAG